jgi:hypothetical protein
LKLKIPLVNIFGYLVEGKIMKQNRFQLFLLSTMKLGIITTMLFGFLFAALPSVKAAVIPTFKIVSVVQDKTVTIQTINFPANLIFTARIGKIGTLGEDGVIVGTTKSGAGGTFSATYPIPAELIGNPRIAIRLESTTGGYFSYNWFNNSTFGVSIPVFTSKVPAFSISSVVKDGNVTIRTSNFPAKKDFVVRMGAYGTLGVGGIIVATTNSGSGGSFSATYAIPASLKGKSRIAIRMDSTSGGYFSYNWFYNISTK